MTYINDQFFQVLKKETAPVYLFCGDEKYIMQKAEQALLDALGLTQDSPDYIRLDGKICRAQDICEQCETLSFTQSRKLVRVSDYTPTEDAQPLIAYMEDLRRTVFYCLLCRRRISAPAFLRRPPSML